MRIVSGIRWNGPQGKGEVPRWEINRFLKDILARNSLSGEKIEIKNSAIGKNILHLRPEILRGKASLGDLKFPRER